MIFLFQFLSGGMFSIGKVINWSFNFYQRKTKKCLKTILRSTSEEILRAQVSNEFHILFK